MGDVIRPLQWRGTNTPRPDAKEDRVVALATSVLDTVTAEVDSTVSILTALRLVEKAVLDNYALCMGVSSALAAAEEASKLAKDYEFTQGKHGHDGNSDRDPDLPPGA